VRERTKGKEMKKHLKTIIIALSIAALAGLIWLVYPGKNIPINYVPLNGSRIYYTHEVTKDQAAALGDFMKQIGYISDEKKGDIKLDKDKDGFIVSIILKDKRKLIDQTYMRTMAIVAQGASIGVFKNAPARIWACDKGFNKLAEYK
jgi:hypothetical protein